MHIVFPRLHPAQDEVRRCKARFIVLCCGRRFGKTMLGCLLGLEALLRGKRVWWIAPSYSQGTTVWREMRRIARNLPGVTISQSTRTLHGDAGGFLAVRSGDRPDLLRGEGLDFAILDEAAFMPDEIWNDIVRPALSDRRGRALIISTPNGHNWFYELYQRGKQGDPDIKSFHFPTSANPFIHPAEIERARLELPARVFAQEYEATFIADGASVFQNVLGCLAGALEPPQYGHVYVAGIDLARAHDYTVLIVMDAARGHVVHFDRMTRLPWSAQRARLADALRKYEATALVDSTGVGDPMVEALNSEGDLTCIPFKFDHNSKTRVIESLMIATERGHVTWPAQLDVLTHEMQTYEAQRSHSGLTTYGAPAGAHDDCVVALALAWEAKQRFGGDPYALDELRRQLPL